MASRLKLHTDTCLTPGTGVQTMSHFRRVSNIQHESNLHRRGTHGVIEINFCSFLFWPVIALMTDQTSFFPHTEVKIFTHPPPLRIFYSISFFWGFEHWKVQWLNKEPSSLQTIRMSMVSKWMAIIVKLQDFFLHIHLVIFVWNAHLCRSMVYNYIYLYKFLLKKCIAIIDFFPNASTNQFKSSW